jgi:hypothetical protein
MLTYGDVGTPVCELSEEFPPLTSCFSDVKHEGPWWHGGSKNCKRKGMFGEKESTAQFKVRCLTWSHSAAVLDGFKTGCIIQCAGLILSQQLASQLCAYDKVAYHAGAGRSSEALAGAAARVCHLSVRA